MSVRFEIDYSDLEILMKKLQKVPDGVEETLNEVLHKVGVEEVKTRILPLIPISQRNKPHARSSKSLTQLTENLGFIVKPKGGAANKKGSFGYLAFPDLGLGTSHTKKPQDFMKKGLNISTNPILEKINKAVDERLQKELG